MLHAARIRRRHDGITALNAMRLNVHDDVCLDVTHDRRGHAVTTNGTLFSMRSDACGTSIRANGRPQRRFISASRYQWQ